jgi:hypothetical protein
MPKLAAMSLVAVIQPIDLANISFYAKCWIYTLLQGLLASPVLGR